MWSFAEEHFGYWIALLVVFLCATTLVAVFLQAELSPGEIVLVLASSAAMATVFSVIRWARRRHVGK